MTRARGYRVPTYIIYAYKTYLSVVYLFKIDIKELLDFTLTMLLIQLSKR